MRKSRGVAGTIRFACCKGLALKWLMVALLLITAGVSRAENSGGLDACSFHVENKTVKAEGLVQDLNLRVLIPNTYQWDDERYLVMYTMDSRSDEQLAACVNSFVGQHDEVMPIMIVRLPATIFEENGVYGEREDGMKILRDDIIPFVERNWRIVPYRLLVGDQVTAGLALQTAADGPDMFCGIVAESSASLNLPEEQIDQITRVFESRVSRPLVVCVATEKGSTDLVTYTKMARRLESTSGSNVVLVVQNGNIARERKEAGLLLYRGLAYCFSDWALRKKLSDLDLKDVKEHYQALATRYSIGIQAPQRLVGQLGLVSHQNEEYDEAIACFKYNVDRFSKAPGVYAAMGAVWEAHTRVRLALINYKKALAIAKKTDSPLVKEYAKLKDAAYHRLLVKDIYYEQAVVKPIASKLTFTGDPINIGRGLIMNPNR